MGFHGLSALSGPERNTQHTKLSETLSAEQYFEGLMSDEAYETPSDSVNLEELEMKLPSWFDETLYNKGRRFFWRFCFGFGSVMMPGLVAIFAVPTILQVLVCSRRSSSKYTAFKRYIATFLHVKAWLSHDLKPGSLSWRSLYAVRSRHIKNGRAARLKNQGTVSQRDLALTMFGTIGLGVLKPDRFGIRQDNIEETREVCKLILERVYTPCLENVPEYFEHMARVMMDGMWAVNGATEAGSLMYITKNLADVPGYVLTEAERIVLQIKLKEKLAGKHEDIGVDASTLIEKSSLQETKYEPRLLYLRNYDTLDTVPEYKKLSYASKYKLTLSFIMTAFYKTYVGRVLLNWYYITALYMSEYFPYVAFFLYGIKNSYVNIFNDSPIEDSSPKVNAEYYKPQPPEPWYRVLLAFW
ncbi:hypothetical protein RR46_02004 [Papilio xuthus]|uniref:ER-bound oxygenase mpaB/mpaB'/Rubber oxygenase catalytic domain-containing protein n=1 Tax=Papilio xuthus TaxID=66420 RepID=A0A194QIM4_PAPXU|nr:hypothetical protein RR46_02004 [Papilio xuthus]